MAPRLWVHLGAGHLDIFYAVAWLPWLLAVLVRGPSDRPWQHVLTLGLLGAMLVLADVRVSLFVLPLVLAVLARHLLTKGSISNGIGSVSAIVVFLPLVLALVIPLALWRNYLTRGTLTAADAAFGSIAPLELIGLLLPAHAGATETLVYVGLPVLVLAMIGLFSRPHGSRLYYGGLIVIFSIWALGSNTALWNLMADFSLLRWFRVPGRAWLIVTLLMALLAGHGMDALTRATASWRGDMGLPKRVFWLRLGAAGLAGMLAVCGGTLLLGGIEGIPASAGIMLIINSLGIGAILLAVLLQRAQPQLVAIAFMTLVYVDLTAVAVNRVEWRTTAEWIDPYLPLAERLLLEDPDRIYSPNLAMPQQVAVLTDLSLFYGVDPFQIAGVVAAIEAGSGVSVESYSVVHPPLIAEDDEDSDVTEAAPDDFSEMNRDAVPNLDVLAAWNVSHVIATYTYDLPGLTYVDTVDGVNIYLNQAYPDFAFDTATVPFADQLPSPEQITEINRWTLISVWVSAISFVVVGLFIAVLSVREARRA